MLSAWKVVSEKVSLMDVKDWCLHQIWGEKKVKSFSGMSKKQSSGQPWYPVPWTWNKPK